MKKTILVLTITLGLSCVAHAQSGLFGRGEGGTGDNENPSSLNNREEGLNLILPGNHGSNNDHPAPLGSGALLLIGFGAAYALTKKKKRS